ncbi:MAG: CidA/LrgA family protein [Ectothiorhodospira sp.]
MPALLVLLLCQLAGEVLVAGLGLPFPGPVVGMMLLFLGLVARGGVPDDLKRVTDGLLRHLALLFVPAGVGLMVHFDRVMQDAWPLLAGLVASTALALAVTLGLLNGLIRGDARDRQDG